MILKIGHRGACGYEPENTLRSFQKALELKVDMVELDVHLCKSGELVVIHDETVDRTTNGKGDVREKTVTELKSLDAGKGEKIPLLQEVFDLVNRKTKVNIELKGRDTTKPVLDCIETYIRKKDWSYDDFLLSSSNPRELSGIDPLNHHVLTGVLDTKGSTRLIRVAEKLNAYSVHPSFKGITQEFVEAAHQKGMKVFVWTVNESSDIERMKSLKVDGIFSDYPDRL